MVSLVPGIGTIAIGLQINDLQLHLLPELAKRSNLGQPVFRK
jgi:hypothetical protein